VIFIIKQLKQYAIIVIALAIFWGAELNINAENSDMPKAGFTNFISEINEFVEPPKSEIYEIKNHNGFKAFMSYKKITDKTSKQYQLQQICYTDDQGFRKFDNRYCVAIGTAFNAQVGQYFDAYLDNDTIIECIVGDIKDNKDTDSSNVFTSQGCCLEFIVDIPQLDGIIKTLGDCSSKCDEWNSPCFQYVIYDINYLEKGEDK
jgi:hypothetical protein